MPRHHVRATQEREDHEGAERRQQQPVVEIRVVDARKGQDEAQIEVHEVDHRQEIVVRSGILNAGHIRILFLFFWIVGRIVTWRGGTYIRGISKERYCSSFREFNHHCCRTWYIAVGES